MDIKIVCPSHKRADRVHTTKTVPDVILCVEERQVDEYREHNPDTEIVAHPNSVIGLTPKRQWMYDHFGSFFNLDDDITSVVDMTVGAGEPSKVDGDVVPSLIERAADMASDLGCKLFGFSHVFTPLMYAPQDPFARSGYVPGHAFGLLAPSKLYWHPKASTTDDYWLSCLNAFHYRTIWKDLRYAFIQKETFTSSGGLAAVRNMDVEMENNAFLVEHFGNGVIRPKKSTGAAKIKHAGQRTMYLPF